MSHTKRLLIYKIAAVVLGMLFIVGSGKSISGPEINRRSLCIVLGIDGDETKITATVQVVIPEQQGSGKQIVMSGEGGTLAEALDRINISIGQKVELGHCGVIILGHTFAQNGVLKPLSYLLASGKISPETSLAVAKDMEAKEFLGKLSDLSKVVNEGINNIVAYGDEGVHIAEVGVLTFLSDTNSESKSSPVPSIALGEEDSGGEAGGESGGSGGGEGGSEGGGSEGGGGGQQQTKKQVVIKTVDNMAMLKEGKFVKDLSRDGTRGLAWLNKNSANGLIMLENVDIGEMVIENIPCKLDGKNASVKVKFTDGKPKVTFNISLQLTIEDKHQLNALEEPEKSKKATEGINKAVKKLIEYEIGKGIEESREADCDVFYLRERFNKFCHKEYKMYNGDILQDLEIEYKIKAELF